MDFGYWRCSECGHVEEADLVVDPAFDERIEAHKESHQILKEER